MPSSAVFPIWHGHGTKELATAVVITEDQAKIGKHSSRQHQLSSAASQNERIWKGDRDMLDVCEGRWRREIGGYGQDTLYTCMTLSKGR